MQELVSGGLYRHYKNHMYRVHGIVRHSETLEELVHYECLYENKSGKFWVRPKAMFLENVTTAGYSGPRFTFVKEA
ncbi:MAG: DUF1653 domain-containing protein [Bdellovibrionales bacterium]